MELSSNDLWAIVQPRLRMHMSQTWDVKIVAEVTESTPQTVAFWLIDQMPPGGRIIKLWHLLAALGHESPELDALPALNRLCGEIYTFVGVGLAEITDIIGVRNEQTALQMMRGVEPARPAFTVGELKHLYGARLSQGCAALPSPTKTKKQATSATAASAQDGAVSAMPGGGDKVLIAAMLFNAALPLARYLDDEASADDRIYLRTLMGEETMFVLSNHFYNLCGERARANRK